MSNPKYSYTQQVTKSNFETTFVGIKQFISDPNTIYAAIDLEFTGVDGQNKSTSIDLISERYYNAKNMVSKCSVTQVGITLFKYTKGSRIIKAYPYNMFIFPNTNILSDKQFMIEAPCFKFLSDNGFNFNKWTQLGVPWISKKEENILLNNKDIWIKSVLIDIDYWLMNDDVFNLSYMNDRDNSNDILDEKQQQRNIIRKQNIDRDIKYWIDKLNIININKIFISGIYDAKIIKYIVTYIDEYKHLTAVIVPTLFEYNPCNVRKNDKNHYIMLLDNFNIKKYKKYLTNILDKIYTDAINDMIGARKIWDMIKKVHIPLVVHNGFLDLMYLYQTFEGELPDTISQFSKQIYNDFDSIWDTKTLASLSVIEYKFMKRSLGYICDKTCYQRYPKIDLCYRSNNWSKWYKDKNIINNNGVNNGVIKAHEAGYDSYITGYAFGKIIGMIFNHFLSVNIKQ